MTIFSYSQEAKVLHDESIPIRDRLRRYEDLIESYVDIYDAVNHDVPHTKFSHTANYRDIQESINWLKETLPNVNDFMCELAETGGQYIIFSTWDQAIMFKLRWPDIVA